MQIWFRIGSVFAIIFLAVSFYNYKRYNYRKHEQLLERLVEEQNKEISAQNEELQAINEELVSQNDEILKQKGYIDQQYTKLTKAQEQLKTANLTLEQKIAIRTKELEESNKTLDKAVRELDRFVNSAFRDLSAPLKSILGLVNIAKLDDKDKNLQVHLNYIEDSIIKQEKVIKSLMQYSRNARQDLIFELTNLDELMDQIILELRYVPGSEYVKIMNDIPKEQHVQSDRQRLLMILKNLVSNSIKYRDLEKSDSFVKIRYEESKESWYMMVEDNGQGIASDQQIKVFDMFHRANEESEGSGLGLFIVREAVDRLESTITMKSKAKERSTFTLEFPKINFTKS